MLRRAVLVACPVCGVRMPEAEVDVHLDLCLYEQTEREEVAEAQRQRQPPRRGTAATPTPERGGADATRPRAASDRRDPRSTQHSPLPSVLTPAAGAHFAPSFPAVPTHQPMGSAPAFPLPPASQQRQQQSSQSVNGAGYMGFSNIPPLQPQLPLFPQQQSQQPQPHAQQQQQQRTGQQSPVQFPAGAAPPPMFYYPVQAAPSGGFPPPSGFQVGPPAGAPPGSTTGGPPSAARQPQPYQPFSVPPTTAQNVQPAFSPFVAPPAQPQPPSSQQTAQQLRFPAAYFTSQSLPHAQPVQFQQQQQQPQQPVQAQYPAQQYYAVPQQLTPQYQAFLQRYQNLQQNQSFSQYPQILQKTPSQQSLLRPAGLLPQEPSTAAAAEREKEKAQAERVRDQQQQQRQQQKEREPEKPIYSEVRDELFPISALLALPPIDGCVVQYCEGWLFVCERPSVRFLKSWVILKEAGLHLSDGPSSRVPWPIHHCSFDHPFRIVTVSHGLCLL